MLWMFLFGMPLILWGLAFVIGVRTYRINALVGGGLVVYCCAMVLAFAIDNISNNYILERFFIDTPDTAVAYGLRALWIGLIIAAFVIDTRRSSRLISGLALIVAALWALMIWDFSQLRWN